MAVREFAVNSGVYSAEYGRAAGGVITSVTKSGTNQFHGVGYFFDRESNWNAFNDYTTLTKANYTSGNPIPTSFTTRRSSLKICARSTASPPAARLIKDRLFWIYTYDQHSTLIQVWPFPPSPLRANGFYATPNATTTGTLQSDHWISERRYQYLRRIGLHPGRARRPCQLCRGRVAYTAGIASFLPDLGIVPRTGFRRSTPRRSIGRSIKKIVPAFSITACAGTRRATYKPTPQTTYAIDTWGTDFVKLDYGVAKLTAMITPSISNEVLYQYGRELERRRPATAERIRQGEPRRHQRQRPRGRSGYLRRIQSRHTVLLLPHRLSPRD